MLSFMKAVFAKYQVLAVLDENNPVSSYVVMMKNCKAVGRDDLADQILMYWRKFLTKYPDKRVNPAAATVHGMHSIKKHLFGGKEFVVWLKEQEQLPPSKIKSLKEVATILPKDVPAIAVPKKNETQDDWLKEAAKTKEALVSAKAAFKDINEYISYLTKEAGDLKKKVETYGEGGSKSKTKSGEPSEYSKRVPKWKAQLETVLALVEETKKSMSTTEADFKTAVGDYNNAPLTTVAYEQKVQLSVTNILGHISKLKDLDEQRDLLAKLDDILGKQKSTASVEVTALSLASIIDKIKDGFKSLIAWMKDVSKSVNSFKKLAEIRY